MKLEIRQPRILVFDVECRPTAWYGGDYVGRSLTAIGWVVPEWERPKVRVLTRSMTSVRPLLEPFLADLKRADLVVGHYIRGFDLPLINAECERLGLAPLEPILTTDTKVDRKTALGLSESLENLVARYELAHDKVPMREPWWEEHNLWQTPRSVDRVRYRVLGDVVSTKELYETLARGGWLKKPKVWNPDQSKLPKYRA